MKVGDRVRFIETDGKHPAYVGRPAVIINADNKPDGKHRFVRVRWIDEKNMSHEYDEFFTDRFVLVNN